MASNFTNRFGVSNGRFMNGNVDMQPLDLYGNRTYRNSSNSYRNFDADKDVVVAIILIAIGVTSILLNLFVYIVMQCHKSLHAKLQNYFLMNRCIVDMVVGVVLIITSSLNAGIRLPSSYLSSLAICFLVRQPTLLMSIFTVSIWNMTVLSIERYIEIVHPIRQKLLVTKSKILAAIICVWVSGISFNVVIVASTTRMLNGGCVFWRYTDPAVRLGAELTTVFVEFWFPLFVIAFCYVQMVRTIRKVNFTAQLTRSNCKSLLRILAIIVLLFLITVGPRQMFILAWSIGYRIDFNSAANQVCTVLQASNCCLNPLIYAAYYDEFRRVVRSLIFRQKLVNVSASPDKKVPA